MMNNIVNETISSKHVIFRDTDFISCIFSNMQAVTFFNCNFENCTFSNHYNTVFRDNCTFSNCTGYDTDTTEFM